jgi:ribose 5-phosphate isomerase B
MPSHSPLPTSRSPILLGSDHAGFALKETIRKEFLRRGYDVADFTPRRVPGDDYPVVGREIARAVVKSRRRGEARPRPYGILICGSGVGVAIAANRVKGARAAEGFDAKQVKLAREHNDANVLTLGAWNTPAKKAMKLVEIFLNTEASKEKRHRRRIEELG